MKIFWPFINDDCGDNKNSTESITSATVQWRFIGCLFEISLRKNSGKCSTYFVSTKDGETALILKSLPEYSVDSDLIKPSRANFEVM